MSPIHPPIQGGNLFFFLVGFCLCDTPSHTGRKPKIPFIHRGSFLIHPPIQGGNDLCQFLKIFIQDTPSHTGRKRKAEQGVAASTRYTLPYREETQQITVCINIHSIHPPIQGGNTQCLCGFQPPQTPRCAICTNSILSLLICHFFNVLADFYKKSFHPKYRKFYQYVFLKVLLHSPVHSSRCGSNFHPIRILSKHGPRHPK